MKDNDEKRLREQKKCEINWLETIKVNLKLSKYSFRAYNLESKSTQFVAGHNLNRKDEATQGKGPQLENLQFKIFFQCANWIFMDIYHQMIRVNDSIEM